MTSDRSASSTTSLAAAMRSHAAGARTTSSRPSATAARESIVSEAPSSTTISAALRGPVARPWAVRGQTEQGSARRLDWHAGRSQYKGAGRTCSSKRGTLRPHAISAPESNRARPSRAKVQEWLEGLRQAVMVHGEAKGTFAEHHRRGGVTGVAPGFDLADISYACRGAGMDLHPEETRTAPSRSGPHRAPATAGTPAP